MRERLENWADYIGGITVAFVVTSGILFAMGQPRERSLVLLALAVVFGALYVYVRPQQVRQVVTGRGARYGSNALVMSIAFIGIIALLNFMSGRYNGRYDLTANKSQSLSEMTIKVLQDLKEPVKVTAFYTTLRPNAQDLQDAQDKLKQYARYSDKFTYRFVDPQAEPQIANDYKVQFDATIVFERGTRRENALNTDEQTLTNALLKVSQDKQPVVYLTTGHGEHGIDDTGANGYSSVKSQLEAFNFKFDTLNLRTITSTLPSDITALVIAGPKQPFQPDEVKVVKDYLDQNGRVLVMADPQTDTGLDAMLKSWGINLRNDVVIDPTASIQGRPLLLIIQSYKGHITTQNLAGFALYFPNSRSVFADTPPPTGHTTAALFSTSANSWGETNFDSIKNSNPQLDANDTKGPLDLAYAAEATGDHPGRLLVIGNSTFLTNGTLQSVQGTANALFLESVMEWLGGQENLIAIPPKPTASNPLVLSADASQFVFLSSFLMLPGTILLIGALIWWRRR